MRVSFILVNYKKKLNNFWRGLLLWKKWNVYELLEYLGFAHQQLWNTVENWILWNSPDRFCCQSKEYIFAASGENEYDVSKGGANNKKSCDPMWIFSGKKYFILSISRSISSVWLLLGSQLLLVCANWSTDCKNPLRVTPHVTHFMGVVLDLIIYLGCKMILSTL